MSKSVRRPSPAIIVAIIALVAALAGSAVALPGKNSVKKNDIAKNAVVSKAIKNDKVTGADVNEASLSTVPSAVRADSAAAVDPMKISGLKKVTAATGTSFDLAREAASPVNLASKGPFTIYGKCFTDTTSDDTFAYLYISTTQAGSVFTSGQDSLVGDDFLDPSTPENDREVWDISTGNNSANGFRSQFDAAAPDGTLVNGFNTAYAKNGTLPGGDGIYGAGDACLFGTSIFG